MFVGTIALIGAAVLFIWGMTSLGREKSKSSKEDDDDFWDDFMLGAGA